MPRPNLKGKISKETADKIYLCLTVAIAITIGIYFIVGLGIGGLWISPWAWVSGIIFSGVALHLTYVPTNRLATKRLFALILICVMLTIPSFTVLVFVTNQNTAKNLVTQTNVDYFKNKLGRSYNYTELLVWENQNLNFTYGDIERNTDPIKIYEYGKGRCEEFATLYVTICISQGYRCRIVQNVMNDHVFNEVLETNGTWIRVDTSLNPTGAGAVGNPMFFEESKGWGAPILSLAFENSTVTDVTSTYRSDRFSLLAPLPIALLTIGFFVLLIVITKLLILPKGVTKPKQQST